MTRLAEIERSRRVFWAAERGMPQRDIARLVHLSQASVHRMIVKARILGVEESVDEIVLKRFTGEICTDEMMRRLSVFPRWVERVVDPVDGLLPEDSESDLDELVADGFLSDAEADAIIAAHA
jgi:hypothetical protein